MQVFHAFVSIGNFTTFLFQLLFHKVRNRPDLRLATCFTDYEKICYSLRDLAQVKRNNILSFFLLNCVNNGFNDF